MPVELQNGMDFEAIQETRKMILYLKTVLIFSLFSFLVADTNPEMRKNQAFSEGEELTFTVKYLFLHAAEAKMVISNKIHHIKNKPTFKIDVYGRTLNIFKLFYVKDNWGSYVDTANIIPYRSYRHIEEGNYRKHEVIDFDHQKKSAHVKLFDRENVEVTKEERFDVPNNVQDIVSGYYRLRTMDIGHLKKGDAVTIPGFFDKKIYNLKLIYEGKEQLSTDIGRFNTHVFSPEMPSNKLFRGKKPIKVWITDDENRIPVRIKANLVVGSLDMNINSAEGLRNN